MQIQTTSQFHGPKTPAKKKMTFLYYMDGKNNLSSMAKHSFKSLTQAASDENVNVVAELGLMKKDVLRGLVGEDGLQEPENLGKADMGNAKTVQEFVEWGMKKYPAEQYVLVLWNHGAGFKGVLTDEEHHSMCTNKDLAKALEHAEANAGQKIDVLNFNACLMNQAEVGYEYRNVAKYVVGSEEVEAGLRIPIPGVFGTTPQHKVLENVKTALKNGNSLSPEQVSQLFVYESKHQFGSSMFTPTQSAIDTSKMEALRGNCEKLAAELLGAIEQDPSLVDRLRKDVKKSQHFANINAHLEPYVDYHDLGDFTRVLLKDDAMPESVKSAAREIQGTLKEAVVAEHHSVVSSMGGRSMEGSTGLSIFLPTDYGFDRQGTSPVEGIPVGGTHGYEKTSFAENSNWEKLLKKISKDDDYMGRFPKINRRLMNLGQISKFYGYEHLWQASKGVVSAAGWSMYPLQGFPFFLPIPGKAAAAVGAVGGALRTHAGVQKLGEAVTRTDSTRAARTRLAVDGAIDTAVGVGSMVTCAAMIGGFMNPTLRHVAQATLALGAGRLAVGAGLGIYNHFSNKDKTVDEKLAEAGQMKIRLGEGE